MYNNIISVENLLAAWREFLRGKRHKRDVQEFGFKLMDNILDLHRDLDGKTYQHGPYQHFRIHDPKPRDIHKATVRDRLAHHAIYRILYRHFRQKFLCDSFSCQLGKGTHRALNRFRAFAYAASQNHTRTLWILKCDVKKFFASIDHVVLLNILKQHISNSDTLWLLQEVIRSFNPGLPLGNLTSQLLVNVYMNEFDIFVKHGLKVKHYLRYADDFVLMSEGKDYLTSILPKLEQFLNERLKLHLHPNKVSIKTLASGVDFLGWVHFPDHRVLRTSTKRRMGRRVIENRKSDTFNSYLGMLQHGNANKLQQEMTLLL